MRWLLCLLAVATAQAASVSLEWIPPTERADGSALTDLAGYRLYSGCEQPGQYERAPIIIDDPAVTSWTVDDLPEGACYFVATAVDSAGLESAHSNGVVRHLGVTEPPAPPELKIDWSEPPLMADATSYSEAAAGGWQLSGTNAIAAKVAAAILPIDDGGTVRWKDVVNGINGALNGGATIAQEGATGDINAGARYTDFDGSNDYVDMGQSYTHGVGAVLPNWTNEGGPAAAFVLAEYTGAGGALVAERDNSLANDSVFSLQLGNSGTTLELQRSGNENPFGQPDEGLRAFGFSIFDADNISGYIDAVEATDNPNPPDDLTVNLAIGAIWLNFPTPAFFYAGKIYGVQLYDTSLSDAEHASLASNPWQIFEADAGATVDPAEVSQEQVLDAPSVSQTHVLAPADIAQAQALDAPAITQDHQLTPGEIAQDQALESPTLEQVHQLAVADMVQTQSLDAVTLVIEGVVEPEDLAQLQELGAVVLTQDHQLNVADLAQLQALESPAAGMTHALTATNLAQLQTVEPVTLIVTGVMHPLSIVQQQALEAGEVTPVPPLEVSNIVQLQALGAPSTAEPGYLVVTSIRLLPALTADISLLAQLHASVSLKPQ